MHILELTNKHVKIGKTSITVINPETNKTCGIVRDICKFKDLQTNKAAKYFHDIRTAGLWCCKIDGLIDAAIIVEDQLYYLHNLKPIESYNKYFKDREGFEMETENVNKRLLIAENMKQFATVIDCYIE